jgi:hypothetical protein
VYPIKPTFNATIRMMKAGMLGHMFGEEEDDDFFPNRVLSVLRL